MTQHTIGRYEIRAEIGRGGMAVVYLGHDPTFNRPVAIKVLPPQFLENDVLRARFEREARTIAALEHPAIVPVHDFGEQDGQLYLVMRYMPGGSLAERIKKGALPPRQAIDILAQLAPALDAVHARGIVHRDLKPANILFDAFGNPALSDFGIAQLSEATVDLTGEAVIGTPAYMSPEQVRSDGVIDGRSDIYALGIILYEMLTGRQPYRAATPMSVAMKHLTEPVPQLHSLQPQFPAEVDTVLSKALAKDPQQRYPHATDLTATLRSLPNLPQAAADATVVDPEAAPLDEARAAAGSPGELALPQQETIPAAIPTGQAPPAREQPAPRPAGLSRRTWLLSLGAGTTLLLGGLCVVVILVVAAYQSGLLSGLLPAAQTEAPPSQAAGPTGAPAPATEAAVIPPAATEAASVLFADDFSTPGNGWPQGSTNGAQYRYEDGAFWVTANRPDILYYALPDGSYGDASLAVQASLESGGGMSYFGLLCRIQDADNFYYLVVRSDGYFTIGKLQGGKFTSLMPAGWTYNAGLAQAAPPYALRADCAGDTLSLHLGDKKLGEAQDDDFTSGKVGLALAAIGEGQRLEVSFDDFVVRALK